MTTRSPCWNARAFCANAPKPSAEIDTSWKLSRSVRYTVPVRRALISMICPSIHAAGQRSTASWKCWLSSETGHGFSGVVSRANLGSSSAVRGLSSGEPAPPEPLLLFQTILTRFHQRTDIVKARNAACRLVFPAGERTGAHLGRALGIP